jgi:hypothetical protein
VREITRTLSFKDGTAWLVDTGKPTQGYPGACGEAKAIEAQTGCAPLIGGTIAMTMSFSTDSNDIFIGVGLSRTSSDSSRMTFVVSSHDKWSWSNPGKAFSRLEALLKARFGRESVIEPGPEGAAPSS